MDLKEYRKEMKSLRGFVYCLSDFLELHLPNKRFDTDLFSLREDIDQLIGYVDCLVDYNISPTDTTERPAS